MAADAALDDVQAAVAAVLPTAEVRFDRADQRPLGAKGRRTRQAILRAAGEVLTEAGWHATTVGAISSRAGVGTGTMYQYFRSKHEVVTALVAEHTLTAVELVRRWEPAEGRDGLRRLIHGFVDGYSSNIGFQRLWEEVSLVDPQMAALRRNLTELYVQTFASAFIAAGDADMTPTGLDPVESARALCAMVDRYCRDVFIDRPNPPDEATVVELLTDLWSRAIGLS